MSNMEYVNTNIRITKKQRDFLRTSEYCLSRLVRIVIDKLMKNKNESVGKFGQHPTDHKPTPQRGDSND